jgi:hypothetical protein
MYYSNGVSESSFLVIDYATLDISSTRINMTNDSATHYYSYTDPVSLGLHTLTVYCNDTEGYITHSNKINISVQDLLAPTISLLSPVQDGEEPNGNVTFVYNLTDATSGIKNCTFVFNFEDNQTNFTIEEHVNQTFNVYGLAFDTYKWRVRCSDNSSNENEGLSEEFTFQVGLDESPPVIDLKFPENNTFTTSNDITFRYTVIDDRDIANCSLIINGKINMTNSSIINSISQENNFTVQNLPISQINWSVNCTDDSKNQNEGDSGTYNLTIGEDNDFPSITLFNPKEGGIDTDGNVIFSYKVVDPSAGIKNCTFIFNGTINQSDSSIQEDSVQYFSVDGLEDGNYTWQVNCTDDSYQENSNWSEVRNFTVRNLLDMGVGIWTSEFYYEKGTQANETANVSSHSYDSIGADLNTTITTYLILGNGTAPWWNTSFRYRLNFTVTEEAGINLWDYRFPYEFDSSSLVSDGKMKDDCSDIRILDNESKDIAYWIQKGCGESDTRIWLNMNLTANSTYKMYMYYGNSSVAARSDIDIMDILGEAGEINISDFQWSTVRFNKTYDSPPIVVAIPATQNNGENGLIPSIGIVNESQFNMSLCEDITNPTCNPSAPVETVHYFVIDVNKTEEYTWIDAGFQYNVQSQDDTRWARINFDAGDFPSNTPYLLAQAQTYNQGGNMSMSHWVHNRNSNRFDLFACTHQNGFVGQNDCDDGTVPETVGWVAIDPTLNEIYLAQSGYTGVDDGVPTDVSFDPIIDDPIIVNLVNTELGGQDPKYPWAKDVTSSGATVMFCEQDNLDYCDDHNEEFVAWFVVEEGWIVIEGNASTQPSTSTGKEDYLAGHNYSDTGTDGEWSWLFPVNPYPYGAYTGVSVASDPNYNDADNFTRFAITVDVTGPFVELVSPDDQSTSSTGNLTFIYYASDALSDIASCTLVIDGVLVPDTTNFSITEGAYHNFTRSGFTNGPHTWAVNCTDDSANANVGGSVTRNFSVELDVKPPTIILEAPYHGYLDTNGNVSLIWNVYDDFNEVTNCTLYLNGQLNETYYGPGQDENYTLELYGLANGLYYWNLTCFDEAPAVNWNHSVTYSFNVTVDKVSPEIQLIAPEAPYQSTTGNVTFVFETNDIISDIANC